jgi:hypothetical protein
MLFSKLVQGQRFQILVTLGGAIILAFGIYDKIVNIKKNKLEIKKLENEG